MKTPPTSSLALASALLFLSPALSSNSSAQPLAAPASEAFQVGAPQPQATDLPQQRPIPREREARALIGRDVTGSEGNRLGRVDDLIIDSGSGQIIYAVVKSGTGSHAVPFAAIQPARTDRGLSLNLQAAEDTWRNAPRFEKQNLDQLRAGESRQEDLHRHFGMAALSTRFADQRLALVSETVGKTLRYEGKELGKIEDVLVHLESGISTLLLDPQRGDDGIALGQKFTLPFRALVPADDGSFSTTISPRQFTSVQTSTGSTSAQVANAADAPYEWSAYGASATVLALTNPPAPFQGRDLSASRPPIGEIRDALAADPNTRHIPVRIVAASDRVILQGVVQDEDARRRVENLVSGVSGGWMVDNRLSIASATQD